MFSLKLFNILIIYFVFLTKYSECLPKCEPLLLSPYIESNRLFEAKNLSSVTNLFPNSQIKSYSGFITVDKEYNSNLFFWFFPSEKKPKKAPVLLWLQGGPGGSSMYGLFMLNGPYFMNKKLEFIKNDYSWNKAFSMLYVDNPVGTGFSYTMNSEGYATNQTKVAEDLYEFLQQFFTLFSEYRNNDFYVTGESYAGKYVPAIGHKLHVMSSTSNIKFKGIAIGNGMIDPISMLDWGSLLYQLGIIDEKQLEFSYDLQNKTKVEIERKNFLEAYTLANIGFSFIENVTGYNYYFNILHTKNPNPEHFTEFLNKKNVQDTIHVGCTKYSMRNNTVYTKMFSDHMKSVKPWFQIIINNYKVLLYSGLLDIYVGVSMTTSFLRSLVWNKSKEYYLSERVIWKMDKEVVGYVKKVADFTFVVFRNAGHFVPRDQPKASLQMIKNFVLDKTFN